MVHTQNLGPKKLVKKLSSWQIFDESNNAFFDLFGGIKTCHFTSQKLVKWQEKPWRIKICQIEDPNQSYWRFFDDLDDRRDFVCMDA